MRSRKVVKARRAKAKHQQEAKFDGQLYFERKSKAIVILGGKCEVCGERDYAVLHFHHFGKKKYALSAVFGNPDMSWDVILEELGNCKLLCANDHARHHARERKLSWERKQ